VLQFVEDALLQAGYEDFAVATKHGTFQWTRAPESRRGGRSKKGRRGGNQNPPPRSVHLRLAPSLTNGHTPVSKNIRTRT
jgi:hypothetical protein